MTDCLFCKIVAGEIPATKVYENERLLAFRDISPVAPTHILIIPKKHIDSLATLDAADAALAGEIALLTGELAAQEGLAEGFRVVANTGARGGQSVAHLHFHLIGGRQMGWPPG